MKEEKLSYYINASQSLDIKKFDKKIRLAILGSSTINGLAETIQCKCAQLNVGCFSHVELYNQFNQAILNSSSNLYKFSPDVTFLILDTRSLLGDLFYSPYSISQQSRHEFIQEKFSELTSLISTFLKQSESKLVVSNFSIPTYSPYGISETKTEYGLKEMIQDLNYQISKFILKESSAYLYDLNSFISRYGENNVFDYRQYFFGDVKIAFNFIPYLANDLMGFIKAILGLTKKCIVLDLDNTLWGGIAGEDGFEGIKLGPDPAGKIFLEFQKTLLALHNRGIILAINSKNNPDDALKIIREHPYMILKEDHFASMRINWQDKVTNMQEIANDLNIGLDSMVFFDDDPVNREFMRTALPQVLTVDLSDDPVQYTSILTTMNDFDTLKITADDIRRGKMYLEEKQRKNLQSTASNLGEFLNQLDIKLHMKNADEFTIPRISQLTLKTNQFNLTTKRYQEEDIRNFSQKTDYVVGCAQVEDKFGDNGITGVYIIKKENPKEWMIDTFLLSCRVMGRGVEEGIMSKILEQAKRDGVQQVKGQFIPTKKNKPAEDFLQSCGFENKGDFWEFSLDKPIKTPKHLQVNVE